MQSATFDRADRAVAHLETVDVLHLFEWPLNGLRFQVANEMPSDFWAIT